MAPQHSWFSDMAFGADNGVLGTLPYRSHKEAVASAKSALAHPDGFGLVLGTASSGKTTIANTLADQLADQVAVALIDSVRMNGRSLLTEILEHFGYDADLDSSDELLKTIGIFAVRQMRENQAPVLIIDNAERMYPSALRCLDGLAKLHVHNQYALRIILLGQDRLRGIVTAEGLDHLARRLVGEYRLEPMNVQETMAYLHSRLKACGVSPPDSVFPVNVCDYLHSKSGGWPGLVNRHAIDALEHADRFPVTLADLGVEELPELPASGHEIIPELSPESEEIIESKEFEATAIEAVADVDDADEAPEPDEARKPPRLILTRDGDTVTTYTFKERKVLIGRSELADIIVPDAFVSKMHALMMLYSDALVLIDLNSANGLTVNSTIVRSTILRSGDIILLGNHRLKIEDAPPVSPEIERVLASGDTIKMRNLIKSRRHRPGGLRVVDS